MEKRRPPTLTSLFQPPAPPGACGGGAPQGGKEARADLTHLVDPTRGLHMRYGTQNPHVWRTGPHGNSRPLARTIPCCVPFLVGVRSPWPPLALSLRGCSRTPCPS